MYVILWIVVGGVIGWLASIITKNNSRMGVPANIIVGFNWFINRRLDCFITRLGSYYYFLVLVA